MTSFLDRMIATARTELAASPGARSAGPRTTALDAHASEGDAAADRSEAAAVDAARPAPVSRVAGEEPRVAAPPWSSPAPAVQAAPVPPARPASGTAQAAMGSAAPVASRASAASHASTGPHVPRGLSQPPPRELALETVRMPRAPARPGEPRRAQQASALAGAWIDRPSHASPRTAVPAVGPADGHRARDAAAAAPPPIAAPASPPARSHPVSVAAPAAAPPHTSRAASPPPSAAPAARAASRELVIEHLDVRVVSEPAPAPRAPAPGRAPTGRAPAVRGAWRPAARRFLGRS